MSGSTGFANSKSLAAHVTNVSGAKTSKSSRLASCNHTVGTHLELRKTTRPTLLVAPGFLSHLLPVFTWFLER